MPTKVIVLAADPGDPKHGEVTVVGSTGEAERLVEALLEAGYDRERIRVFTGAEMDARVSQRPVVALVAQHSEEQPGHDAPSAGEETDAGLAPDSDAPAEAQTARLGPPALFGRLTAQPVEMMPELHH